MPKLQQMTLIIANNNTEDISLSLWLTERFVFLQFRQKRWLSVQKLKIY
jgi:hypothetical protein